MYLVGRISSVANSLIVPVNDNKDNEILRDKPSVFFYYVSFPKETGFVKV